MDALRIWSVLALQAASALGPSPGPFTHAGNLTVPRAFHTATLLTTGKVLLTGGMQYCGSWASAELYDPSTGTFTATRSMHASRYMHTATLLPNGKVLIAGGAEMTGSPGAGNCHATPLASAELYDSATGTFSATANMATARLRPTATLLHDGKVLIAGGVGWPSAELYDPSTGSFTATGDMTEAGADTATLLPNGRVLITRSVQWYKEDHADLYDPATGTFTRTSDLIDASTANQFPLAIPGQYPSAILMMNGKVLLAGGAQGDFYSASAETYDPGAGAFRVTGGMTAAIGYWQAAALLPEGKVLITGESPGAASGTAELYDPATGAFSAPFDSDSSEGHAATLLPDGTVMLSGGWDCCGYTLASAQVYHPAVLVPSPVLFSLSGAAQSAILHGGTARVVSPGDPAVPGEGLEIYGTGMADSNAIPPQVAIGGRAAEVVWFGAAPGFPSVIQVNIRVPSGVASGPAVPLRLSHLGRPSNEVTLAVQ
jgi:hypothetical protein